MLQGHGDDGYRYGKKILADFSTNVWYGGEPKGLKDYVFEQWPDINRYPEVVGENLTEKIAVHHGLSKNQVLTTNGTTESIYLIAQLFAEGKTTIVTPTFSEYEDACSIHKHELRFVTWTEALELPRLKTDVLFLCNPNNPTGLTFPNLTEWLTINRQTVFIIDEAFIDFAPGTPSMIDLINEFDNLLIMRSLTKAYGIPGLRLGYVVAQDNWIDALLKIKQPWSVNALALAAGSFIFDHYNQVQPPLSGLLLEKSCFQKRLMENEVLEIGISDTHFFLCKTLIRNAAHLKTFLMENHGILIRDAGNFRGLSRQHFRVATLAPESNIVLINALTQWRDLYY